SAGRSRSRWGPLPSCRRCCSGRALHRTGATMRGCMAGGEMSGPVTISVRDGVALVVIDNPPVNALDEGVRTALRTALTDLAQDARAEALGSRGQGRTFVAGPDMREVG